MLAVKGLVFICFVVACSATCYFPPELQGDFQMQFSGRAGAVGAPPGSTSSEIEGGGPSGGGPGSGPGHGGPSQVRYSTVTISSENISTWGHCERRIGHNVILKDNSGSAPCIRCFHLQLKSRYVLRVLTEGLDKCYSSDAAAELSCPDPEPDASLDMTQGQRRFVDLLLYKVHEPDGQQVRGELCPVSGRFHFVYNVNDGSESNMECPVKSMSRLDTCPSGAVMALRFRGCSFEDHNITFGCLGSWPGPNGQKYLALLDTRSGTQEHPQYRCALVREERDHIQMAFSSDSTCTTSLRSASDGYETLVLTRQPIRPSAQLGTPACRFPAWAQGHWQHLMVNGGSLTYQDKDSFTTLNARCAGAAEYDTQRFLLHGRTQCGDELYTCIWMQKRATNVLEFQLGLNTSHHNNLSLCSDSNFRQNVWMTQGRTERSEESPCPITGGYEGHIPDAMGLCARMTSNCRQPEVMYYSVSDCKIPDEMYEDVYTPFELTKRGDMNQVPAEGRAWRTGLRAKREAKPVDTPTPVSANGPLDKVFRITGNPRQLNSESRRPLGPQYPSAYNISTTTTTEAPEEEYDPWAYPRMHGYVPPSPDPTPWPNPPVYALPPQLLPSLSPRAPTDRGMEFGDRGAEYGDGFNKGDSGWTLEHRPMAAPRGALPVHTEEREYRCLGQWSENGLVYTYTYRRDVGTYECFVGEIISNTAIFIKEAGEHCARGSEPLNSGMKLERNGSCILPGSTSSNVPPSGSGPSIPGTAPGSSGLNPVIPYNPRGGSRPLSPEVVPPAMKAPSPSTIIPTVAPPPPRPRPTPTWTVSRRPPETNTKPWKPITAPPRPVSESPTKASGATQLLGSYALVSLVFSVLILLRRS